MIQSKNLIDMFFGKSKLLKQREEELAQVRLELVEAKNVNTDLISRYSRFIEHEEEFQREKKALEEMVQARVELNQKYVENLSTYKELKRELELFNDTLEIGSFGLYQPRFNFDDSESFKEALTKNYEKQKELINEDKAVFCSTVWQVNNSKVEGKRMTRNHKKLILLAFNGECDSLVANVKWNNVVKSKERIIKLFEKLNKLGSVHDIEIRKDFLDLKVEEIELYYEYQLKKYEEKEEQKRIRDQRREEEKSIRDYEKAQREAEEEEKYLQKALEKIKQRFGIVTPSEVDALNEKVKELERQIQEVQEKKERAIALAQTTKVGFIYVISNIGTFGENIYKIGMTRRLDPQDRVDELSNASVPFRFDVHAVIFSENAPQLEYELHQKFNDRRINKVNRRKEFFNVKLEEIEEFVKGYTDSKAEFTITAEAKEYRETMSVIEQLNKVEGENIEFKYPDSLLD